uniref:Uncharacterized protein n=1 Tax=Electrophorus electricus TaxID=8005 RepID=A0AAY5EA86_ELEEL
MSDVVEKTLTALPSLLSLDSQPGAGKLSSTSKLGQFIRNITELTSKHVSMCPHNAYHATIYEFRCSFLSCEQAVCGSDVLTWLLLSLDS